MLYAVSTSIFYDYWAYSVSENILTMTYYTPADSFNKACPIAREFLPFFSNRVY
jgi:hypothetical protein